MKETLTSPIFKSLNNRLIDELFASLSTPCYVIDEQRLKENCSILKDVSESSGCKILLAQKAFSNYDFYPLLSKYLDGTEASGLFEARLGYEEMPNKEVHVFCGAYTKKEFDEILRYADHIVFNSPAQLAKFGTKAKKCGKSLGLRINPECSTQDGHAIYDPCADGSRLGTTRAVWNKQMTSELISLLDGLHFHTLCEQNSDDLKTTLNAVEEKFGDILQLENIKWLNMGGGHHITKVDYDRELLKDAICYAQSKWNVQVYLEPGEAVALNAGYLLTRVLDIVENNGKQIAILDASPACHMPDVIEMPYTPPLLNADKECNEKYVYRLAGATCLSGDVIADYGFEKPLEIGDILIFGDMAIYTTCKNNTFNGMPLPQIYALSDRIIQLTNFDYSDFKCRLGTKKS